MHELHYQNTSSVAYSVKHATNWPVTCKVAMFQYGYTETCGDYTDHRNRGAAQRVEAMVTNNLQEYVLVKDWD